MSIKVIIAGSRSFTDYPYLSSKVSIVLSSICNKRSPIREQIVIVSGKASGAYQLGERFAAEYNIPTELHPADWSTYGNRAGFIRNEIMAKSSNVLIAFWDGNSKGTRHMIHMALNYGLETHVFVVR